MGFVWDLLRSIPGKAESGSVKSNQCVGSEASLLYKLSEGHIITGIVEFSKCKNMVFQNFLIRGRGGGWGFEKQVMF